MNEAVAQGLFSFLVGSIDGFLNKFVISMSGNIASAILPIYVTGLSIWTVTYGLAVMRGEVAEPVMVFVKNLTKILFISVIAFGSAAYQTYIVEMVNQFVAGMVQTLIPNSSGGFFAALDVADEKATMHAAIIVGHGASLFPFGGYLDIIAGMLELTANTALLFVCGGYGLVAHIALSLMLALGPLFIAALAFPPTAKFFEAWMSKVANYAVLIILLAAMVPMALAITGAYIDKMETNYGKVNAISDAFGLVLVNLVMILVAWQMPQIAAALTGGTPVSGGGLVGFLIGKMSGGGGKSNSPKTSDKKGGEIKDDS